MGVILFNHSTENFSGWCCGRYFLRCLRLYKVKRGDRIAQLILERIVSANVVEVTEIEQTDRWEYTFGGLGSFSLCFVVEAEGLVARGNRNGTRASRRRQVQSVILSNECTHR